MSQVSVPGARPPTESNSQIQASGLLRKIRKKGSVIFADGNRAWAGCCKDLALKHDSVSHQLKVFTKLFDVPNSSLISTLSGTQIIDRSWLSLKSWLPKLVAKIKNANE